MKFLIVATKTKKGKALAAKHSSCLIEIDIEEYYSVLNEKPYLMTPLGACKKLEHFIMAKIEDAKQVQKEV